MFLSQTRSCAEAMPAEPVAKLSEFFEHGTGILGLEIEVLGRVDEVGPPQGSLQQAASSEPCNHISPHF